MSNHPRETRSKLIECLLEGSREKCLERTTRAQEEEAGVKEQKNDGAEKACDKHHNRLDSNALQFHLVEIRF